MLGDISSPLCSACKGITFTMLLDGFVHPKHFTDLVVSGRTCRLCRLIVCMHAKLQRKDPWNPYEVEKDYDAISVSLPSLPAVRRVYPGTLDLPHLDILQKPGYLTWTRNDYGPKHTLQGGYFGGRGTIQVTASEGEFSLICAQNINNRLLDSYYYSPDMVPLRDVYDRAAPENYAMLRKWLRNCMKTHKKCRPLDRGPVWDPCSESVALPTRLVDVGSPTAKTLPFLAETGGNEVRI